MITQYPIAATQKYNFPHEFMDSTLPQRFTELSLYSLRQVQNKHIQLNQEAFQHGYNAEIMDAVRFEPTPLWLKPRFEQCCVAAVDTSSIKIGETPTGILVAVRGATVCRQNKSYNYTRFGPFIFHITEENKTEVYRTLQRAYFGSAIGTSNHSQPQLFQMPMRIAGLLERWLQSMVTKAFANGLILFDGSLTSGTSDSPTVLMKEALACARRRNNAVLAFSKMTTLRINGHLVTETLPGFKPPYLLRLHGLKPKPPTVLLGEVYVARLNNENYAFRLDIDRELTSSQRVDGVEKLMGNESVSQSYPESLRLAHILCTFTANEVIAIQHFAVRQFRLEIVNRPDMHRLLFGPFGRGDGNA